MTENKKIGMMIKFKRMTLGMTQDELSKTLGYKTKASISKIENGHCDVPLKKLRLFAEVLKIDINDLLSGGVKYMLCIKEIEQLCEFKQNEFHNFFSSGNVKKFKDFKIFVLDNPEIRHIVILYQLTFTNDMSMEAVNTMCKSDFEHGDVIYVESQIDENINMLYEKYKEKENEIYEQNEFQSGD